MYSEDLYKLLQYLNVDVDNEFFHVFYKNNIIWLLNQFDDTPYSREILLRKYYSQLHEYSQYSMCASGSK